MWEGYRGAAPASGHSPGVFLRTGKGQVSPACPQEERARGYYMGQHSSIETHYRPGPCHRSAGTWVEVGHAAVEALAGRPYAL